MNPTQPDLRCTFSDAERNNLLAGIRLSTQAKIDFFEEMVSLAVATGARDRSEPDAPRGKVPRRSGGAT
ncbi:MAG TPA: hypothetical protein VFG21_00460 [Xanthomonadaceae bacterium]|nr:hypothetical protein [Xanthomonadaceae bacterium]